MILRSSSFYRFLTLVWGSILFCLPADVQSQEFSFDDFKTQVLGNHPMARGALLQLNQNRFFEQQVRGAFDPKLYGNYDRKDFSESNYWQVSEGGVKLPTPFGAEFKLGYQHTQGVFLNPEQTVPDAGQATLGVSVPLIQGLSFDDRRFGMRQAEVSQTMNSADAQINLNKLILDAGKAYYDWAYEYQVVQIRQKAVDFAQVRFEATVESFQNGYQPAMDTLESFILVQDRQIALDQSLLDLDNARVNLSNWLWNEQGQNLELAKVVGPGEWINTRQDNLPQTLEELLTTVHPENDLAAAKIQQAEWDRRLKAESLKPRLDVEYNLLSDGFNLNPQSNPDVNGLNNLFTDNYKVGVKFAMPLLFRKERASVQLADIKIAQNEMLRDQKQILIQNKQLVYLEQLRQIDKQITESIRVVANYRSLADLEIDKFAFGQSSIFLINSREQKLIDAELKLMKLYAAYQKAKLGYLDATNNIAPIGN
ncbi:MAG: TolC family protein [Bacteroidota bacterium]